MAISAVAPAPSRSFRPAQTAAERDALLVMLDDPAAWPHAAASLLAELGFRLVGPDGTSRATWHLLVALRRVPTLCHFDPEVVSYYSPVDRGAALTSVRHEPAPVHATDTRRALWGHVHVIDRIPVENRFLTFGGLLRSASIDRELTVLDLASPAPIVRWGGHSQGTEDLAGAMGAFFGRLIVPVDFVPGAEASVDSLPPEVLYRAFLADGLRRAASATHRGRVDPSPLDAWIAAAWLRARQDTTACDAAERLLRRLRLDRPFR